LEIEKYALRQKIIHRGVG